MNINLSAVVEKLIDKLNPPVRDVKTGSVLMLHSVACRPIIIIFIKLGIKKMAVDLVLGSLLFLLY